MPNGRKKRAVIQIDEERAELKSTKKGINMSSALLSGKTFHFPHTRRIRIRSNRYTRSRVAMSVGFERPVLSRICCVQTSLRGKVPLPWSTEMRVSGRMGMHCVHGFQNARLRDANQGNIPLREIATKKNHGKYTFRTRVSNY